MTFALSLPEYERNLSSELSALQQNGELVDMTVAADGHLVRVHRLLLASVSPYLKELITSTTCTQPVLFLNNLSYSTLCSLLEYIYTGEVHVSVENITDVLNAGKALRIKGLEDTKIHDSSDNAAPQNVQENNFQDSFLSHVAVDVGYEEDAFAALPNPLDSGSDREQPAPPPTAPPHQHAATGGGRRPAPSMQYTLSNRGSLQMVLNRYMYYVKYSSKRSGVRQWRCVDYIDHRCPATVVTKDDAVLKRIAAHNHPYHDKRILKKTHAGAIFSTLLEAEEEGQSKKMQGTKLKSEEMKT